MRKVLVAVTQEDIDMSPWENRNARNCPVARAISRTLGEDYGVDGFIVWGLRGFRAFSLPSHASIWIAKYDNGESVEPFHFEMVEW